MSAFFKKNDIITLVSYQWEKKFNWQIPWKEEGWSEEETKCESFERICIPPVPSIVL